MKTSFTDSFAKDLQRIKDRTTRQRTAALVTAVEQAPSTEEIVNLKRLKGTDRAYHIRLSDYRAGVLINNDTVTICAIPSSQRNLPLLSVIYDHDEP